MGSQPKKQMILLFLYYMSCDGVHWNIYYIYIYHFLPSPKPFYTFWLAKVLNKLGWISLGSFPFGHMEINQNPQGLISLQPPKWKTDGRLSGELGLAMEQDESVENLTLNPRRFESEFVIGTITSVLFRSY